MKKPDFSRFFAFNKILKDTKPIKEVCSEDDCYWIATKVKNKDTYEDENYIYYRLP